MNKRRSNRRRRGFTLVEVLVAVLLVGLAIASLVATSGAFTIKNGAAVDLSTAEFLIEEIRERTAMMGFDELAAMKEASYCPPIDVNGEQLEDFGVFGQQVRVECVGGADLDEITESSDFVRVTVTITKNGRPISSASWIRAKM
ncbi:MAG TPA: prepilin-type N-terminal cleavage/methylation domain-containing protein [Anaerohalosphaeraceae bacterium]|nr:prepilin-type N-terminal cleavage/methylation domain-containing protein [Anaerohalosphaeraceae bacterium]HQG06995.1 prepilin-type N-terminal cleavage/methylation domain-containing protein [Anaerohalosphaeraceae bacterium]HQI08584.1 prepilin-type N-terminal cleavage/methylation domain-containing protein [Anaerohalosphaeraceae bacterium]HQJ68736.1 prepilin-type N-terminal cleavage/methylation domain-containing protein [Anaerohalosphaeraceae bacterium]